MRLDVAISHQGRGSPIRDRSGIVVTERIQVPPLFADAASTVDDRSQRIWRRRQEVEKGVLSG